MDHEEREFKAKDSLGKFWILGITMATSNCGVCGCKTPICIRYQEEPRVSAYVAKAPSLLIRNKKTKNFIRTIGINCGCYAKVHRQVAHIEGGAKEQKARKKGRIRSA